MLDLSEFFAIQSNLLARTPVSTKRFLHEALDWNTRLLGIVGGRGTGKTTLLLQHAAEHRGKPDQVLYVSADHIRVHALGLYEIGAAFFRLGGETLIIDEAHKYARWSQEMKNLYDSFPAAKIRFSGSSTLSLQKGKADLSRRVVFHTLPGLSFREYLHFAIGLKFERLSLSDILTNHSEWCSKAVKAGPILGHFRDYLDHGVYPFFLEGLQDYFPKLFNVIEKVLYEDIPATTGLRPGNVAVLKQILWLVSTSQPFAPNVERMSRDLRISKEYVYTYLDSLEKAGLLLSVLSSQKGYRLVRKPAKIYMENSNLLKAVAGNIGSRAEQGTLRETFFAHQIRSSGLGLRVHERADFLVEKEYVFEIGGGTKGKRQIKNAQNAFVVRDDIEVGHGDTLPLWLFGFLY